MSFIKKHFKGFKRTFLNEFSSIKLAITLFLLLAIMTLIGTIIPEEPMVGRAELIKKYSLDKYRLFKSLGFTDVFHSWWYLALLTTLWLNLIIASFTKVFPRSVRAFSWPVDLTEEGVKKLPINCEIPLNDTSCVERLENNLKERKYKTKIKDGKLFATKGGWHRLGASVTHVGILILLVGSLVSTVTGYNGMAQVQEGEGFYPADLGGNTNQIKSTENDIWLAPISKMPIWFGKIPPYLVRVNKTWRVNYEGGQPKQWYSDLSVFDQNKKELARKTIFVNNPLEFMGLDIYQSNWGKFIQVSFNNEGTAFPVENFNGEEVVFLPLSEDVGLKLKPVQEDRTGRQGDKGTRGQGDSVSRSPNSLVPLSPHPPISISDETRMMDHDVLELYSVSTDRQKYLGTVRKNERLQLGPINIGYSGTETLTGLQFKSNPGAFLIYPGLFFIICGVFISFGSKKQIWAQAVSNNKIIVGGNSDRAKGKFFEEFESLVSELVKN